MEITRRKLFLGVAALAAAAVVPWGSKVASLDGGPLPPPGKRWKLDPEGDLVAYEFTTRKGAERFVADGPLHPWYEPVELAGVKVFPTYRGTQPSTSYMVYLRSLRRA